MRGLKRFQLTSFSFQWELNSQLTITGLEVWCLLVEDLKGGAPIPFGPFFFDFMQYFGNFDKIICWCPPSRGLALPRTENPGSAPAYPTMQRVLNRRLFQSNFVSCTTSLFVLGSFLDPIEHNFIRIWKFEFGKARRHWDSLPLNRALNGSLRRGRDHRPDQISGGSRI